MTRPDLVVEAGRLWTPDGFLDSVSIVIESEQVVDIVATGSACWPAGCEVLQARDKVVLPGLIDTHSHHREPGFTEKETIATATAAAALGGVTTSIGMPNVKPSIDSLDTYRDILELYRREALVDFNVNALPLRTEQVADLHAAGVLGFKIWMIEDPKRDYPHMPGLGVHDDADLLAIFEAVRETGVPLMVHPHNQSLMTLAEQRSWDQEERGPLAYAKAQRFYDGLVWDTAIDTLVRMQSAVGTRLHVLHLVTTPSVDSIRRAKAAGAAVTAEVNPFGLFLGSLDLIAEKGPYALGRWVPDEVKTALWAGLRDGTIDVIGTDHAPHTKAEKERGWTDMWSSPSGTPQLQDYLSQLLSVGVGRGLIELDAVARAASYNPARIFGLYPRKGVLQPGADADLVVIDLDAELVLRNEDALSRCGWTPYDGTTVRGVPVHTVLRGRVIVRDRTVLAQPGWARQAVRTESEVLS